MATCVDWSINSRACSLQRSQAESESHAVLGVICALKGRPPLNPYGLDGGGDQTISLRESQWS